MTSRKYTLDTVIAIDVICPWCFIGKKRFDVAVREFEATHPDVKVCVKFTPYQLSRQQSYKDKAKDPRWSGKYSSKKLLEVQAIGKDSGAEINYLGRVGSSVPAFRLIQYAQNHSLGLEKANSLTDHIMSAYFVHSRDIGETGTLVDLATQVGYAAGEITSFLNSDALESEILAKSKENKETLIGGVPFFTFCNTYKVPGAQETMVFTNALERIYRREFKDNERSRL
eukprot:Clim_evm5s128 gene=Clim_evmTU5s128